MVIGTRNREVQTVSALPKVITPDRADLSDNVDSWVVGKQTSAIAAVRVTGRVARAFEAPVHASKAS